VSAPPRVVTPELERAITDAVVFLDSLIGLNGGPQMDGWAPAEVRDELLKAFEEARAE
jgi:hypothetical protein